MLWFEVLQKLWGYKHVCKILAIIQQSRSGVMRLLRLGWSKGWVWVEFGILVLPISGSNSACVWVV